VRGEEVRVLFGSTGWPCGMLEVASWAKRAGLARPVIFQLQPGYAFHLDLEDRRHLAEGRVHPEIVDSFARRGRPLGEDSCVRRTDDHTWEIRDGRRGLTYRLVEKAEGLEVTVLENLEAQEFTGAIAEFADKRSLRSRFFGKDGSLSAAAREALMATGGQFVEKLIELDPHVVGFRLEGGGFEQVKAFIRTVRLFSDAEVVLGGPTATSHPRDVLEECGADYVFAGEAEEAFNRFLDLARLPNSKDRQPEIPGLAYRYGGRVYVNTLPRDGYGRSVLEADSSSCGQPPARIRNLLRPVASSELIAANRLDWSLLEGFSGEFDSLFFTGGRGCPGACTFCAKLHGPQVRIKSAAQLLEEIEAADAQVAAGSIKVSRWPLLKHVDDAELADRHVSWVAIYDEDFFLNRRRAIEFFRLWDQSPLRQRYRLNLQTNPCSLLSAAGQVDEELLGWIDRLKPMVQLGAESFNPELLARWHKRHDLTQLNTVLDALDGTRQDYTVFQLLTDFETTPEELVETLRVLILGALKRRRMRIASSPFTIPLYDSQTRLMLEYRRLLGPERIRHFTDYERPQPGWMDPLAAELAEVADAHLQWTLNPESRESGLLSAMEAVLERITQEREKVESSAACTASRKLRMGQLDEQARRAMDQINDARFQAIAPARRSDNAG